MKEELTDSFQVFVRLRPQQEALKQPLFEAQGNTLFVNEPGLERRIDYSFAFDQVFSQETTNLQAFQCAAGAVIESFLKGYNATVFAYGTTGSGKTHSMFGAGCQQGFVQLAAAKLLAQGHALKVSYLQIYNQQVRDLLKGSENLGIVQDPVKGVLVPGLSQREIVSIEEMNKLINQGNLLRVMAPTSSNQFSSRSHAIVQISVGCQKFSLVDLAGSERAGEGRGARLTEGCNINKSLLALGNCIVLLSQRNKKVHIPYRDSKLTRLLKDSLGGNAKTVMIACVSPFPNHFEDTICTLKYATRARKIQKQIRVVRKDSQDEVEQLKEEVRALRAELGGKRGKSQGRDALSFRGKLAYQLGSLIEQGFQIKESLNEVFEDQRKLALQLEQASRRGKTVEVQEIKETMRMVENEQLQLEQEMRINSEQRLATESKIGQLEEELERMRVELANARLLNKNLLVQLSQKNEVKQPNERKFRRSASVFRQQQRMPAPQNNVKQNFSSVSTNVPHVDKGQILSRSVLQEKSVNVCVLQKKRAEYARWKKKLLSLVNNDELAQGLVAEVDRAGVGIRTQQDSELIRALYCCARGDFDSIRSVRKDQEMRQVKQFLDQFSGY